MKIGDNIASEFDEFSVNYTQDMIRCVPYYLDLITAFDHDLPKNAQPQTILDLGCGNGNVTAQLVKNYPEASYVLVDASEEMIELCSKRFSKFDVTYVTSYFDDFEFKSDSFNLITAGFSLHHVDSDEKKKLFKNIYNALTDDGVFGYSDLMISKTNPEHKSLLLKWKSFVFKSFPDGQKWDWLMEHYNQFDKPDQHEEQKDWLALAGFNDIRLTIFAKYWTHMSATKQKV